MELPSIPKPPVELTPSELACIEAPALAELEKKTWAFYNEIKDATSAWLRHWSLYHTEQERRKMVASKYEERMKIRAEVRDEILNETQQPSEP